MSDLYHEWHVAINKYSDETKKDFNDYKFMYEAKRMQSELPRMIALFKAEREQSLGDTHQQCSFQKPEKIEDNHLKCCKGVECRTCPDLLALEKIDRSPEDVDTAKAWTCATHIVATGGDVMGEGYLLTKSDRMFWDNLHTSLAQG